MKNSKLGRLTMAAILMTGTMLVVSCGSDEDPIVAPEASFTSVIDGKTVAFTNTTTGDEPTYSWDFGDGSAASTEASPSHTYEANGTYVVKLTATNEGGSDESQAVLEVINVKIDGDFSDWDDVASAVSYADSEGGTIVEMKVENLGNNKLYIYIKGTSDMKGFVDFYLNTDNDIATGGQSWQYPAGMGAEYLIEGDLFGTKDADIFLDNADSEDWCWTTDCTTAPVPAVPAGSEVFVVSDLKTVGSNKIIEFSIDLDKLSNVSSESIGIAITDVDISTWGTVGSIPVYATETSALYVKSL